MEWRWQGKPLADDNSATITNIIEEACTLGANLHKGVCYYLACKLALISTTVIVTVLQRPIPFAPIPINVMEAYLVAVGSSMFTAELLKLDVMLKSPYNPTLQFLDQCM